MKTAIIFLFLLTALRFDARSETSVFTLDYATNKNNNPFQEVKIIDLRPNKKALGFVKTGINYKLTSITFEGNLPDSLVNFFKADKSNPEKNTDLILILHEFFLTTASTDAARFRLNLRCFTKKPDGRYSEVFNVDTTYKPIGLNIDNKLYRCVSEHFKEIAEKTAVNANKYLSVEKSYTYSDLSVLDSLEKSSIPIYNSINYKQGIFLNYEQFKNNTPELYTVKVDSSNLQDIKIYYSDTIKKKVKKLDNNDVFAISDGISLYKATSFGFYKLIKENNNLVYDGQTSFFMPTSASDASVYFLLFGIVGNAIYFANTKEQSICLRYQVGYLRGNSIPIGVPETANKK